MLRLAGGLQVQVEHQIAARVESPRKAVRFDVRRAARLPEQKIAVRIEGTAADLQIHAGKTFPPCGLLQPRRSGAVHQKIGMMHHARQPGPDLDRPDSAAHGQIRREDDVPIKIGT